MTEKKLLGKKSTFKIASLFMKTKMQKTKIHAVFELGTCGLVEQSYTHCATNVLKMSLNVILIFSTFLPLYFVKLPVS